MRFVARVERVAAQFQVWVNGLPFPVIRVKVLEVEKRNYVAVTNVHIRELGSDDKCGTSGLGDSIESALDDLVGRYERDVKRNTPEQGLSVSDFIWSDHKDF